MFDDWVEEELAEEFDDIRDLMICKEFGWTPQEYEQVDYRKIQAWRLWKKAGAK